MTKRECDFCKHEIDKDKGVRFNNYDLCDNCVTLVRRAICRECRGTGKINEVDRGASTARATCGENRTEYRTILCPHCK